MVDPLIGQRLGNRYEILEKVGDGGMAVVYRARDTLLGRLVAVKVLREQFVSDSEFLTRFRLEAQSAASLAHPNVVNIYDVGEDAGVHFIVMEYVEGENLKELIRREGPLPVRRAVFIATEIARALDAAHRRNLIHRDIKPHNILITAEGAVKVTDFGIARAASAVSLTQTGTVIGSVHYFSPEQARGDSVDSASDIYSLGVVLYELVTGRMPFTGESAVSVALKHVQDEPEPADKVNPQVPAALNHLIGKMMAKKKSERYTSAGELLKELRGAVAGAPQETEFDARVDENATQLMAAVDSQENTVIRHGRGDDPVMPKKEKGRKRGRRWVVIAFVLLSFFAGIVWAAQKLPDLIFPEIVRVPDITGLELDMARDRLAAAGLKLDESIQDVYNRDLPAGRIIRQDPEANHRVRMGRAIRVTVSRGPRYVVVPDVIGVPKIEAQLQITQQNLTLGEVTEEYNPDVPPNTVIGQDPPGSTRLEEGKAVDIVVARGSQPQATVVMPDVRGMTLSEAERRLQSLGFVEGQLHAEPHPRAPENQVIDQNPPPGEEVEVGYPYALAYAVPLPSSAPTTPTDETIADKYWENRILINVPEGPPQEIVILVTDDWGPRQAFREVRQGGSRFYHTVRIRGGEARIQVWFDGVPQMNEEITRPSGGD